MGTDISTTKIFVDGDLVHDADLNAIIDLATIEPTAISSRSLKTTLSLSDELLINDTGTLKKITGQQVVLAMNLPPGAMIDYGGTTEPLGWVFCYGQELSRTTYAALFAAIGLAYGSGNGVTTFNVPDFRGRTSAGKDNMGGTSANRITSLSGMDGDILGNVGGLEYQVLTAAQMPFHTHYIDHQHGMWNHYHNFSVPGQNAGIPGGYGAASYVGGGVAPGGPYTMLINPVSIYAAVGGHGGSTTTGSSAYTETSTLPTSGGAGSSNHHPNMQPTIICNKIIKT